MFSTTAPHCTVIGKVERPVALYSVPYNTVVSRKGISQTRMLK
jgi:hypothetical protein